MKWLIHTALALLLAAAVGVYGDRGYVLVHAFETTMETSLFMFVLLLGVLYWVSKQVWHWSWMFFSSPKRAWHWRLNRRLNKAQNQLRTGALKLMEGDWSAAEKLLSSARTTPDMEYIAKLGAAIAADQMNARDRRDRLLETLSERPDNDAFAAKMTELRFALAQQHWTKVDALLTQLLPKHRKHPALARVALDAAVARQQWEQVPGLLRQADKLGALTPNEREQIEWQHGRGSLEDATGIAALDAAWSQLGRAVQGHPALVCRYAEKLSSLGDDARALAVLRRFLDSELDDRCLQLLTRLPHQDPGAILADVERWLKQQPNDPALLLCAGELAMQAKLWGKARSFLEHALKIRPGAAVHLALARLHQQLQEPRDAILHYEAAFHQEQHHGSDAKTV